MTDVMMSFLTVGQIAKRYALSEWQVRRAVDAMESEVPRAGLYRIVPMELLPALETELRRRGWLRVEARPATGVHD